MATIAGQLVTGTLTTTGDTVGPFQVPGNRNFNVFLGGTWDGQVAIQRSYDGGSTYTTMQNLTLNTLASFTAPTNFIISEPDPAILYRAFALNMISGSVSVRFG